MRSPGHDLRGHARRGRKVDVGHLAEGALHGVRAGPQASHRRSARADFPCASIVAYGCISTIRERTILLPMRCRLDAIDLGPLDREARGAVAERREVVDGREPVAVVGQQVRRGGVGIPPDLRARPRAGPARDGPCCRSMRSNPSGPDSSPEQECAGLRRPDGSGEDATADRRDQHDELTHGIGTPPSNPVEIHASRFSEAAGLTLSLRDQRTRTP